MLEWNFMSSGEPARSNKFWIVSEPMPIDHGGVEPLLESWGVESVYFRQRIPNLQGLLKRLGRPRIIEVAVPIVATRQAYSAARSAVAAFGRSFSCRPDDGGFDLYVV